MENRASDTWYAYCMKDRSELSSGTNYDNVVEVARKCTPHPFVVTRNHRPEFIDGIRR